MSAPEGSVLTMARPVPAVYNEAPAINAPPEVLPCDPRRSDSLVRSVMPVGMMVLASTTARADAVLDWNARAATIATQAQVGPLVGQRVMAVAQVAVLEAVNAIEGGGATTRLKLAPAPGASVEAAVAEVNRVVLSALTPSQQPAIDAAYQSAQAAIPAGRARDDGIAVGKLAAAGVLGWVAGDGADAAPAWRPPTVPGAYVPTALPVGVQWGQRKPWLLTSPDQFRPGPPPGLSSATWARDFNESKAFGGARSPRRTAEQTAVAKFWEGTAPTIYHAVIRSAAARPGRDALRNARLLATASQAIDDALIAVFDAKYHYNFWRPITAIRNGDQDDNEATERDAGWVPFIDTPMHPEYPCAHCILAGAVAAVLEAEVGKDPMPTLSTTSPRAPGVTRSWRTLADFVQEVSSARIHDGVHYRNSTEVGSDMGRRIGAWAAAQQSK